MKTLDLAQEEITLQEVLKLASTGALRILAPDGHTYILEDADEFDKEVELLGKSRKFQEFLSERSKEPGTTSLDEYRESLD